MEAKKKLLTYAGLKALEEELENLKVVKRKEVAAKIKEAREQLDRYLEDKRMKDKANLKKFVIVFEGFDKYYVEEL